MFGENERRAVKMGECFFIAGLDSWLVSHLNQSQQPFFPLSSLCQVWRVGEPWMDFVSTIVVSGSSAYHEESLSGWHGGATR